MAGESTVAIFSDDILCFVHDRDTIVTIVSIVSIDGDILSTDIEAVGVLWRVSDSMG